MLKTTIKDTSFFNDNYQYYSFSKEQYIHNLEFLVDVQTPHYTISKGTVFKGAFYKQDGLKQVEVITHTGGHLRINFSKLKIKNEI